MTSPSNLLTDWSTLLFGSLADAGVRDVILSPGSRSTPFALAAMREPRVRCHTVIDERAAAFFALGQARMTARPSVLLCTSGSAGAHYFPAVVEASAANLPLLAITADRPTELQACAAPQTIDQVKLFGDHVRAFFEAGMPDESLGVLRGLRRMAAQAVLRTLSPTPGPVHLNVRARKPLEPAEPQSPEGEQLRARVRALLSSPIVSTVVPEAKLSSDDLAPIVERCARAERGLIVCGPASFDDDERRALYALARATRFPLFCEATSQLRFSAHELDGVAFFDAFDAVARSPWFKENVRPDLIVQIGGPPTSSACEAWLGGVAAERIVVAPHGWNDPQNNATTLLVADVAHTATAIARAVEASPERRTAARVLWTERIEEANRRAWACADAHIAAETELGEGEATRVVVEKTPSSSVLVVGNSLAVRHLDTWVPRQSRDIEVVCQRGANGIDGLIAGTFGAASVAGRPVTLLIGDVSFLHDVSSLMLARDLVSPVVIVVLQNGGGRIFEGLPLGRLLGFDAKELEPIVTPHSFSLGGAAQLFGHRHRAVRTRAELEGALGAAYAEPGCTVVEVIVPPHGARIANDRLFQRVAEAVADLGRESAS